MFTVCLHMYVMQQLGVPCFLGGMSRGLLGRNSPIHIRQKRKEALKDCDFVLLAGVLLCCWSVRIIHQAALCDKTEVIAR